MNRCVNSPWAASRFRVLTLIDEALARLVERAGGDLDAFAAVTRTIPLEGLGPWSYATECLARGRRQLLRGVVGEPAGVMYVFADCAWFQCC